MKEQLLARVATHEAELAVIGLGYVGLPLAMAFADAGFRVKGIDVVASRVRSLRDGKSHIADVPSGTVAGHVASGRFVPSDSYAELLTADVVFICVPTPADRAKAPDLSYVQAAASALVPTLHRGQLVVLESTTYPGTTDEVLVPILERSGLTAGSDFFVAFSPERIDPGNQQFTVANTPKVVGGIDPVSTEVAAAVLGAILSKGNVHVVSSARAAELTKLLENSFRAVNIALVNELAMLSDRMHLDVWEVIDAAATKPYGFMRFSPGPGVGGHCIPVDPYYLAWKARQFDFATRFITLAAETNDEMPEFAVEKLRRALQERKIGLVGARILVVGAAFKPDVDDVRNSPAIRVIELLGKQGARVSYYDPHVAEIALRGDPSSVDETTTKLRSVVFDDQSLGAYDCVAILVAHNAVDYGSVVAHARLVFDAVNATRGLGAGHRNIVRL